MFSKLLVLYLYILLFFNLIYYLRAERCSRVLFASKTKTPADGRFKIEIDKNYEKYTPGTKYLISLYGLKRNNVSYKFNRFRLSVGNKSESNSLNENYATTTFGVFSPFPHDSLTELECGNLLKERTKTPKQRVQVEWTAPAIGSGCVVFRASVSETADIWYMDDGPLSLEFCEDDSAIEEAYSVNEECCACSEAKYEFAFEGKWSRNTHPKDFPRSNLIAKFSNIIGASHSTNYWLWKYDNPASAGLKELAEKGDTTVIEEELKENVTDIRTIIKAQGFNINITGPSLAVFRVDQQNHIVSFVTKIDPSPDWFLGVSGLDLCTTNCHWLEKKELDLYPWDAGTDLGRTYEAPDQPANPPYIIRRIKTDDDINSPFYLTNGEKLLPLGRLVLTLQRTYDKTCLNGTEEEKHIEEAGNGEKQEENDRHGFNDRAYERNRFNQNNNFHETPKQGRPRYDNVGSKNVHETIGTLNSAGENNKNCKYEYEKITECSRECGIGGWKQIIAKPMGGQGCTDVKKNIKCNRYECNDPKCENKITTNGCDGKPVIRYRFNQTLQCCVRYSDFECVDKEEKINDRNSFLILNECIKHCIADDETEFIYNSCPKNDRRH